MTRGTESGFSSSCTLDGVLSRIREGDRGEADPALRSRIDGAFARHEAKLRAFVATELRRFSPQQVEDTVQEVLAVAWVKLAGHEGPSFRAWLFGIAKGECANVRRKKAEVLADHEALLDAGSEAATTYRDLRQAEREHLFREATRVLDPRDQEIFHMRYTEDLPRDEIARLLGLDDADEVRVALQRSKRLLAAELDRLLLELGHSRSLLRSDSGER